jgi:hypothetical protein
LRLAVLAADGLAGGVDLGKALVIGHERVAALQPLGGIRIRERDRRLPDDVLASRIVLDDLPGIRQRDSVLPFSAARRAAAGWRSNFGDLARAIDLDNAVALLQGRDRVAVFQPLGGPWPAGTGVAVVRPARSRQAG